MKTISNIKRNLVLVLVCAFLAIIAVNPASTRLNASGTTDAQAGGTDAVGILPLSFNSGSSIVVDENENLKLIAEENYGIFAVIDKKSGTEWRSTRVSDSFADSSALAKAAQSLLTLDYVNVDDEVTSADFQTTLYSCSSTVSYTPDFSDNKIRIIFDFSIDLTEREEEGDAVTAEATDAEAVIGHVKVPVEFSIDNDSFNAKVDVAGIESHEKVLITKITLLPYFGASTQSESGYIFVPDGSGALINFKGHENTNSAYNQRVYGEDLSLQTDLKNLNSEAIRMPVFGIKKGDSAYCAIITSGAASSKIEAAPVNLLSLYSHVNAAVETKLLSKTVMFGKSNNKQVIYRLSEAYANIEELAVEYHFLNGDDANYVGMAKSYRNYLQNNGLSQTASKPVVNVDAYGAIDVRANFLGFNYYATESLTTYNQLKEMAEKLKKSGITNIGFRYIGWSNNGVTNDDIVDEVDFISELGGKNSFESLVEYMNKNNIPFSTDSDLITYATGSEKKAAKSAFADTYYKYQYLRSVYAYDLNGNILMLLKPEFVKEYGTKFIKSYTEDTSNKNISLSTITNTVYSSLKRKEQDYRIDTVNVAKSVLESASKNDLSVSGTSANDYTFNYLSKIYKAPLSSSGYKLFDEEIPFYQIVLHSSIAMTGEAMVQSFDKDTMFLKCVESGSELLWNGIYEDSAQLADTKYDSLYGSTYTTWQNDALEKYNAYYPLLDKIYDQEIVGHEEVLNNVTVTEYANGIKVYVNYTDSDVKLDNGITVSGKYFAVKEG